MLNDFLKLSNLPHRENDFFGAGFGGGSPRHKDSHSSNALDEQTVCEGSKFNSRNIKISKVSPAVIA